VVNDDKLEQRLKQRLKEEQDRVETIKAELYSSLGKIALLKELLMKEPPMKGMKKDAI